jgi:hypothetical protein
VLWLSVECRGSRVHGLANMARAKVRVHDAEFKVQV